MTINLDQQNDQENNNNIIYTNGSSNNNNNNSNSLLLTNSLIDTVWEMFSHDNTDSVKAKYFLDLVDTIESLSINLSHPLFDEGNRLLASDYIQRYPDLEMSKDQFKNFLIHFSNDQIDLSSPIQNTNHNTLHKGSNGGGGSLLPGISSTHSESNQVLSDSHQNKYNIPGSPTNPPTDIPMQLPKFNKNYKKNGKKRIVSMVDLPLRGNSGSSDDERDQDLNGIFPKKANYHQVLKSLAQREEQLEYLENQNLSLMSQLEEHEKSILELQQKNRELMEDDARQLKHIEEIENVLESSQQEIQQRRTQYLSLKEALLKTSQDTRDLEKDVILKHHPSLLLKNNNTDTENNVVELEQKPDPISKEKLLPIDYNTLLEQISKNDPSQNNNVIDELLSVIDAYNNRVKSEIAEEYNWVDEIKTENGIKNRVEKTATNEFTSPRKASGKLHRVTSPIKQRAVKYKTLSSHPSKSPTSSSKHLKFRSKKSQTTSNFNRFKSKTRSLKKWIYIALCTLLLLTFFFIYIYHLFNNPHYVNQSKQLLSDEKRAIEPEKNNDYISDKIQQFDDPSLSTDKETQHDQLNELEKPVEKSTQNKQTKKPKSNTQEYFKDENNEIQKQIEIENDFYQVKDPQSEISKNALDRFCDKIRTFKNDIDYIIFQNSTQPPV